jgi:hypothetical protein
MGGKNKTVNLEKYKIQDLTNVSTLISDSMIHYDLESKGLLNLIRFKTPKDSKPTKGSKEHIDSKISKDSKTTKGFKDHIDSKILKGLTKSKMY